MLLQDETSEETPLARRPRRSRPSKHVDASSQPSKEVTLPSKPAVIEAVVPPPAMADVPPVVAPAEAKTTAPAEGNTSASAGVGNAAREKVAAVEPEATAETPVHPHDVDLGIPPQEVSSNYVRVPIFL